MARLSVLAFMATAASAGVINNRQDEWVAEEVAPAVDVVQDWEQPAQDWVEPAQDWVEPAQDWEEPAQEWEQPATEVEQPAEEWVDPALGDLADAIDNAEDKEDDKEDDKEEDKEDDKEDDKKEDKDDDENDEDAKDVCYDWELDTADGAMKTWVDSKAAEYLDAWVDKEGEDGWLRALEELIRGDIDKPKTDGCTQFGSDCTPRDIVKDCSTGFKDGDSDVEKRAFWILAAVQGVQEQLTLIHDKLYKAAMLESLGIEKMHEDLAVEDKKPNGDPAVWLSRAFAIVSSGAGAVGANPATGAAVGILSTVFGTIGAEIESDEDNKDKEIADLKKSLQDACKKQDERLTSMLRAATGRADSDDDYDSLPGNNGPKDSVLTDIFGNPLKGLPDMADDGDYKTRIGKFFASSPWLINLDTKYINAELDAVANHLRYQVLHQMIMGQGYNVLHVERHIFDMDESDCKCDGCHYWSLGEREQKSCVWIGKENGDVLPKEFWGSDGLLNKHGLKPDQITWWYMSMYECWLMKSLKNDSEDERGDLFRGAEPTYPEGEACYFETYGIKH